MTDALDAAARLFVNDGLSEEEIARQAALYGPLADDVRALIPLAVQSRADDDDVRRAREHLAAARELLGHRKEDHPFGTRFNDAGNFRVWGNAAMGLRNAIAPLPRINQDPDGRVWADFHLHVGFEGPAGHTHGGVSALILDQLLGDAARVGGSPGMTGTLTLRYRRPTPLGDLHGEAKLDRIEGRKGFVTGHIAGPHGICVEAEGIFIRPNWPDGNGRDRHRAG
ncbi:hotdog domain-containing protein [Rhodococcus sp. (in: high G+C Gram-positive bacteria)]|jgi:acyl-coenzyme A thioesterase PaaI-like protein|uniref:hotdog domain-containing protein n=1 Tax=Rhodococcus sp. TaxID=1831 RepID=UPI0019E95D2E|nr:hotdog domain-containing protein [Rhodococcus sp. (in: high G+C Gram-positive bacteria)]MBF0661998.1 thioesterase [Rhodococcus sp. (in: high G+C Gram-positive bacteria)]